MVLSDNYEPVFPFNTKQSGVARLVRITCKAFHIRGSDEAGVASYFNSYLAGQSEKSNLLHLLATDSTFSSIMQQLCIAMLIATKISSRSSQTQ